jgi:hypothetical protein
VTETTGGAVFGSCREKYQCKLRGCLETKPLYEKELCHIQGKAKNRLTG